MDIRVLKYFLTVAQEENITNAAERLHISQPPLSRQIHDLENELGVKLFERTNRKVILTEEGILLKQRAEEIIELVEKTKADVSPSTSEISGDIYIGSGETEGVRTLARVIYRIRQKHPGIHFHFYSGHAEEVSEKLDKGLLDFGICIEPANMSKYELLKLPTTDCWGVLMRKDNPLAEKKTIKPKDLLKIPIITANQAMVEGEFAGWSGGISKRYDVVATYNLLYNASLLVEENVGVALCIDEIIRDYPENILCFRPLEPSLNVGLDIIWKKHYVFSKAAEIFLEELRNEVGNS
ncbi:MAG: LysR family transcriptional regulator [Oscillospiraceae bacterium]|nr:LysR family transcriptional regulator [Oscillospiraceae bacterium]